MIKAKYTQGDNIQEFEFNSVEELLEYEQLKNGNSVDCTELDKQAEKLKLIANSVRYDTDERNWYVNNTLAMGMADIIKTLRLSR